MPLKTNEQLTKNTYKTLVKKILKTYKTKMNTVKTTVSKTHKESWDRFISRIECDISGKQSTAYKVLKTPQTNKQRHY